MEIRNSGYNFGEVVIDTVVTAGVKTEIGDAEDFKKIAALADAGGVIRVHITVGDDKLDGVVKSAFGCDMMSDVLAFVKDQAVLLTGLCNPQVIRTAEMMDIVAVCFVRGKVL